MIVFALATGHKIAIGAMGAIFIAFALVSSFVLPRRSPNFPNRNVGLYVLATVVLFAAMLTTILVFGVEEESGAEAGAAETSSGGGEDTSDDTGVDTEPEGATETQPGGPSAAADVPALAAAPGKQIFASAGATRCRAREA